MYATAFGATMGMPGPSQARGIVGAQSEAQQLAFVRAAELKQLLSGLERVDDEDRRASLLDTLFSTVDILNLPVHPNPPGTANGELMVDLLKHQVRRWFRSWNYALTRMLIKSQALQWCIGHEYPKLPTKESDSPAQFWQYRKAGDKVCCHHD